MSITTFVFIKKKKKIIGIAILCRAVINLLRFPNSLCGKIKDYHHVYSKYSDTLIPNRSTSKIWTSLFYNVLMCLKTAGLVEV